MNIQNIIPMTNFHIIEINPSFPIHLSLRNLLQSPPRNPGEQCEKLLELNEKLNFLRLIRDKLYISFLSVHRDKNVLFLVRFHCQKNWLLPLNYHGLFNHSASIKTADNCEKNHGILEHIFTCKQEKI